MKGGTTQTYHTSQIKSQTETNTKKPTAEQIRYAQLLNDEHKDLKDQIRQVADVTGRSHDEVSVALHDCNYDTELTINSLLEGRFDQNEWITSSSRKKKHQGASTTSQGIDNIITGNKQKDGPRQSRSSRGGRNRASDRNWDSEQKDNDENRPPDSGRGRGFRDDRSSSDRKPPAGRGGPPRRGRGGNRGRSSSRGRGGRVGRSGPPPPPPSSNGPTVNGTEMWDNIDADDDKDKTESWEDSTQPTEVWGSDDYIPSTSVKEPVAPTSVASLFSSVSQSNSWPSESKDQPWGNDEAITTNGTVVTSTSQSNDTIPFTPESVDMAIIHSKLAQSPSSRPSHQHTASDVPSMMHIPLTTSVNHDLGPISKLLDSVTMASLTQQTTASVSHTTAQPQRQSKPSRSKKSQKSQIPLQAVEMPDSMMDELDVEFGNLEFGGDFSASPIKTKPIDTGVSLPSEDDRPSKQNVESEGMSSLPSTLSSSLSRSVPVTIASTTSAASSLTGLEDNSPRHYQHASPREHKPQIKPEPIPFPNQSRDEVHHEQVQDRPKTPPSTNDNSSMTGATRSQTMSTASLQAQLVSSLPKENTLDSRAYQVGQHVASQPTLANKDQLSSSSLGHHSALGGTTMTTSQQRTDSNTSHTLQPPPGVGVPHSTAQQVTSSMGLTTATVSSSSRPAQHSGKPSLPPGVLPINTLYGIQQAGMVPGYSMPFSYEELQRQMHIPPAYYDMSGFQTGRDNLQGTFPTEQKFGRSDASSPVQSTINQPQAAHHMQQQQQAYLNAASMPPYGFGGLAFYPGGGMMPGGFPTYSAPAMYQQMAPKTHVNVSQYQQQAFNSQHGSHNYSSGYDDLSGGHDFTKSPYHSTVSQTQSKSTPVVSTSADLPGAASSYKQIGKYNDSKAFIGGTPPPLNLSVQGQHSHLGNYPGHTQPFMSMVPPTQQHHPHSLFHHHPVAHQHQDIGQTGMTQRGQQNQLPKQSQSKGGHQGAYSNAFWSNANKS